MIKTDQHIPELRFPSYDTQWMVSRIEELFEFKNGLNKEKEFFGRGTPIINFKDVYNLSGIYAKNLNGLVELSSSEIERYSAQKGDVFFTRTSETIHDIGMSAALMEDIENCVFSGFVLRARPISNQLSNDFKMFCFNIYPVRKEIVTKSSFTTRALTSGTLLKKVIIKYPASLPEQQKIADFLSTVDKKIQALEKKKALLEQYKKGVMQKIFKQEIRFKQEDGSDYREWVEKRLGDIVTFSKGKGISKSDIELEATNPCIRYGELYTQYGEVIDNVVSHTNLQKEGLVLSEANDLIIPSSGETNIDIATASCVLYDGIILGGDLNIIKSKMNGVFLAYYMNSHLRLEIAKYGQGVSVVHLYSSHLKLLKLLVPSLNEQTKIANSLSAIDDKIKVVTIQIDKMKLWKKGLLQQMFV